MKHMFDYLMNSKSSAMRLHCLVFAALLSTVTLWAEGSKDFISYGGYRLFLDNRNEQQLKVYAAAGETINVGASHVGISGGYIKVYRPDGVLAATFDGTSGGSTTAIIFDNFQEQAGPVGGTTGYKPGIVKVQTGQDGIWTVEIAFPVYEAANFLNILNGAPWNRAAHQPTTPNVITAWDITVSSNGAGNEGGTLHPGRVYSNEYVSVISQNGYMTSPEFFVLTKGGFLYEVRFMQTDPFRFPITSVSRGIVDNGAHPTYNSHLRANVSRSANPLAWVTGNNYYYEPQAADYLPGNLVNNKIFFNKPDENMPATAMVTDIFRNNTHTTWLFNMPSPLEPELANFVINANNADGDPCVPDAIEEGEGAWVDFTSTQGGVAYLSLDLNNDGDYDDLADVTITKSIDPGPDSIYWNGRDGLGNIIAANPSFTFGYKLELRDGETHILLSDIENNMGGVIIRLISNVKASSFDQFYYNHSNVGGPMSGVGPNGQLTSTNVPFVYQNNFGENKILDYWAFVTYAGAAFGTFTVNITTDCLVAIIPDTDGDGIRDNLDIDDDNDGVPDRKEFCNPTGGFACLPGARDASGDADGDGVLNYRDANDPAVPNNCTDANGDGVCDNPSPAYDTDGDKVPDHLDLDSDNDGITDLFEAGHNQPDVDGNGVIDGAPADFGLNGLYSLIASDPDDFNAVETYSRTEWDGDGVPDHDDLDSDNDGINDVAEAGYGASDTNDDGRLGGGSNSPAVVNAEGLSTVIDPFITGQSIPMPPDRDNDGVRDWHDLDSDNDLIHDVEEGGNPDSDNDAIIGTGTPIVDTNGKAIAGTGGQTLTTTSAPINKDGDSRADYLDHDTDNDGINDVAEANGTDPDNDGMPGTGAPTVNAKGIPTNVNNIPTSQPTDTDGDGVRDYRDLDSDNDGINDVAEATRPDGDGDGIIGTGIPNVNSDGRAITDPQGNQLSTTSAPVNTDNNGQPDYRDLDTDDDSVWDVTEASQPDPDHDGIIGSGTLAVDDNGQASAPNLIPTSSPTNTDGQGEPDFRDLDADDDGIVDADECPLDAPCIDGDGDGTPDFRDYDRDNDGIDDAYECENSTPCSDTDGDGTPDVDDLDTDGDGLTDAEECSSGNPCPDSNTNGIPNWREYTCHAGTAVAQLTGVSSDAVICEGESISLTATNSIVLPDTVNYTWIGPNNFSFNGTAEPEGPFPVALDNLTAANNGDYILTVYTEYGCPSQPATVSVMVTQQPTTPSISVSDTQPCNGEDVTLTTAAQTGPSVEYLWYFGTTLLTTTTTPSFQLNDVNLSNSGSYTVKVQRGSCESAQSAPTTIVVTNVQNLAPTLSATQSALCQGDILGLAATGIPIGASFEWFFNNGSSVMSLGTTTVPAFTIMGVSPSNTGTYSVVALAGGCISPPSNVETIVVGGQLNQTPVLAADAAPCQGAQLQLSATAYPGLDVTYQWMFDAGSGTVNLGTTAMPFFTVDNISSANSGDYMVVAGTTGCPPQNSNVASVAVNTMAAQAPSLTVANAVLCQTQSIELSTSAAGNGAKYYWYFNAAPIQITGVPNLNIDNATTANTGDYSVAVHFDGCTSPPSASQTVTVTTVLSQTPVLTAVTGNLCEGETLQLTSSNISGATYEWFYNPTGTGGGNGPVSLGTSQSPSFTIANASSTNSGLYTVQATIAACTSQPSNGQNIVVFDQMGTPPNLSVSANVLCEGETLTLSTSAQPGTNVQYEWFFNGQSIGISTMPSLQLPNMTATNSGLYSVVAGNGNCLTPSSNAQAVNVTNDIGPALSLSVVDDVLCEGETLELNSSIFQSTNVTYNWYFNDGNSTTLLGTTNLPTFFLQNMTDDNVGIYTVIASVGNCATQPSNAQDVSVTNTLDGVPTLTASAAQLCEGETLTLNSSTYPGANVEYLWYFHNGSTTTLLGTTDLPTFFIQNMVAGNEGTYTVAVASGNCTTQPSNAQSVDVTNALSGTPILTASATQLCEGETLTLNSSTYPGTNVEYLWYFHNGSTTTLLGTTDLPTFFIQNMAAGNEGTYTVAVASGNCTTQPSNAQSVDVTNTLSGTPTLTVSATQLCFGETLTLNSSTLGGTNASYLWYFDNGNGSVLLATTDVPTYFIGDATAANAGTYSVVVASGNCSTQPSNTAQVAINNTAGQALQLTISDDQFCLGATLTLNSSSAPSGMQYQWYFDDGSGLVLLATTDASTYFIGNFTTTNVGTYAVAATNGNCSTPLSNLEAAALTQSPLLVTSTSTDAISPACGGDLVQLNVTPVPGAIYEWSGPQGFTAHVPNPVLPSVTAGQGGDYTVTVTIDGCNFTAQATTVHVFTGIAATDDLFDVYFNGVLEGGELVANDHPGNAPNWQITIVEAPGNGTAKIVDGRLDYTPRLNFYGADELTYEICNTDCPDDCARAIVRINVLGTGGNETCFAPNIITPNGDGRNDVFEVPCLETAYTNNNVRIFNRWGDKIFEQDSYANDWDGRYKGNPLPPGTYFYLIQLDKTHSEEVMQGYFTITR